MINEFDFFVKFYANEYLCMEIYIRYKFALMYYLSYDIIK
jgi:hypothetical protein